MKNNKNLSIEGLRGLSLLLVMFSHYFARFIKDYVYAGQKNFEFLYMSRWGTLGVAIFLLISGYFMIPSKSTNRVKYINKRFLRIYPAYFLSVTICFIITHLFVLPNRTVSFTDYLLNIFLLNGFIGTKYVDHAHWYITTLIACTLCFSLIYNFSFKKRHYCYWVWLLILVIFYYIDFSNSYFHLLKSGVFKLLGNEYAPVMIIGASIADIRKHENVEVILFTFAYAILVKFLVESGFRADFIVVLIAVPVFLLFEIDTLSFLRTKQLLYLGRISYPIYLIHQNIGFVILYYLMTKFNSYHFWMSFLTIPIGILFGHILYNIDLKIQTWIKEHCSSLYIQ